MKNTIKQKRVIAGAVFFGIVAVVASIAGSEKSYAEGILCNPNARTIDDAVCIQDVNQSVINSMEEGNEYYLIDSRDEEEYIVGKLADGKVWMLDNLRLGGTSEIRLTSRDTNIDESVNGGEFILPSTDDWADSYEEPYLNDYYKWDWSIDEDWLIGNYYNYCAASAGTYCGEEGEEFGDAKYDICPAGWRMPTGGYGGEYETLYNAYGAELEPFGMAFHLTLSGRFYDYGAGYIDENGYFWSSSYRDGARMRYLLVSRNDGVAATSGFNRDRGYSVRCVAKGNEAPEPEPEAVVCNASAKNIDEASCMQDMNPLVKHSMSVGRRYTLVDKRDGEKYTVAKLRDGNVWLLDNLRLGKNEPITLTAEDTNLVGGSFVLPAGGNWENTYVEPKLSISNIYEKVEAVVPLDVNPDINVVKGNLLKGSANIVNGLTIGNYYNYCAVSAGTVCDERNTNFASAESDICPAGWRMPTDAADGEFARLYSLYDNNYDSFMGALRLPLSGRFYSGYVGYLNYSGYTWSSTYRDEERMRIATVSRDSLDLVSSHYRDRGFSMRCVVKVGDYGSGEYEWVYGNVYSDEDDNRLVLRIDFDIDVLIRVEVDGNELDANKYALEEGSTIINFKDEYLDTLADGTYAVKAVYKDGLEINTEFIVINSVVVPNTGTIAPGEINSKNDFTGIAVMAGVLATVTSLGGFVIYKRYHRKMSF